MDVREPRVSLAQVEAIRDDPDLEELIAILRARAVLSDHDLQEFRERRRQRRHAARRVSDLDSWSL